MGTFEVDAGPLPGFLSRPRWPARLRRLTLRDGSMRVWMRRPEECVAAVAFVGGAPVGWVLAVRIPDGYRLPGEPFAWKVGWYVAVAWRRKGVGRALSAALVDALPAHVTRLWVQPGKGAVDALVTPWPTLDSGMMELCGRQPMIARWRVVRVRDES